jgi:hypothetical protein
MEMLMKIIAYDRSEGGVTRMVLYPVSAPLPSEYLFDAREPFDRTVRGSSNRQ